MKQQQSSLQAKLVEVTESQGKEIVTNMEKLGKIKEQNVANQGILATKTINYFKDHDFKTAPNQ